MTQDKIDRINELARKSRTEEGLTEAEASEQKQLRSEYVNSIKRNLSLQLENTVIVDEHGNQKKVTKKGKRRDEH